MNGFADTLRDQRERWEASGRADDALLSPMTAALARLWLAKQDRAADADGALAAFIEASLAGHDVESLWDGDEYCRDCGETYRLENMVICTACRANYCWRCNAQYHHGICACGGEML